MIPYSRSKPSSSEDLRESPQSQEVRKPLEVGEGEGRSRAAQMSLISSKVLSVISLCARVTNSDIHKAT